MKTTQFKSVPADFIKGVMTLDDNIIIDLYFERNEKAIEETDAKYGKLLRHIAFNILNSRSESEECVDDTYVKAWGAMPPERPSFLRAFLAKITRNLSINKYLANRRKSVLMHPETIFEEIAECVPDTSGDISEDIILKDTINSFLESLEIKQRKMFVKRYFYMLTVKEISTDMGVTVSNVKVTLLRIRDKFKVYLEKAGIVI